MGILMVTPIFERQVLWILQFSDYLLISVHYQFCCVLTFLSQMKIYQKKNLVVQNFLPDISFVATKFLWSTKGYCFCFVLNYVAKLYNFISGLKLTNCFSC